MIMQSVVRSIFPPQCVTCDAMTSEEHGLCATCWKETRFLRGLVCDSCGCKLEGSDPTELAHCDDCLRVPRPWDHGRASFEYSGRGRKMVLGLKHGDRTDLVPAMGRWLEQAAKPVLTPQTLIVPIPLHWRRMFKRRYNQAALLAQALGSRTGHSVSPDALRRVRSTKPLEGHSRDARFEALSGSIEAHPKRGHLLASHDILLIDDVMTTGATFTAAALACRKAGAHRVCVLALARVCKDT